MSDNTFTCGNCNQSLDWSLCVSEEALASRGYDEPTCYDCVATDSLYHFDRNPYTMRAEEIIEMKAAIIQQLKGEREEDFSDQAEDPYDDRDFIYDFDR